MRWLLLTVPAANQPPSFLELLSRPGEAARLSGKTNDSKQQPCYFCITTCSDLQVHSVCSQVKIVGQGLHNSTYSMGSTVKYAKPMLTCAQHYVIFAHMTSKMPTSRTVQNNLYRSLKFLFEIFRFMPSVSLDNYTHCMSLKVKLHCCHTVSVHPAFSSDLACPSSSPSWPVSLDLPPEKCPRPLAFPSLPDVACNALECMIYPSNMHKLRLQGKHCPTVHA